MGEMSEVWKEVKKDSADRKKKNLENGVKILMSKNIRFESFNNGYHLRVEGRVDFWPSTGKWIDRKIAKEGRGVFQLIGHIRKGFPHGNKKESSQEKPKVKITKIENQSPAGKAEGVSSVVGVVAGESRF